MNNKFPIYRDAYVLVVTIKQVVHEFGRYHKYILSSELHHNAYLLLEYITFAINDKTKCLEWINNTHLNSECLKIKMQFAKTFNLYPLFLSDMSNTWTVNFNNPLIPLSTLFSIIIFKNGIKQRQIAQTFITN